MSRKDFLKLRDLLVPPGVSLSRIVRVLQPIYAKDGIKNGKQRVVRIDATICKVIVRTLFPGATRPAARSADRVQSKIDTRPLV